jgi:dephospho-CoA kinase
MKVLGIVGMPGSGKGEFSAIASDMGIPVVIMGDVIRSEVQRSGLPPDDKSMGIVATRLREEHGMSAIAKACIPVVELQKADTVLIDGIRGDAEVKEFAGYFPEFTLIAIDSPLDTRFERLCTRARSDDLGSMEELASRDERESSFGLRAAIDLARVRIPNTGTLDEFRVKVRTLLDQITGVI